MTENTIIQAALKHFTLHTGFNMIELPKFPNTMPHKYADTCVEVVTSGKVYPFWVEVKNELRNIHLNNLIQELLPDKQNWLLICQYISKPNRLILKERGINYLDASGNCFIQREHLMVYINDQKVSAQRRPTGSLLWKPAGMKLLFSILINQDLLNQTYRHIAQESTLSLGTVAALMQELEKEKYFSKYDTLRLEDRDALTKRWTQNFKDLLYPKILRGQFRFATVKDRENWKNIPLKEMFWGGEPAGALLTNFLYPEKFSLYSNLQTSEIMKQLRLVPSQQGELEVLQPFWNTDIILSPIPSTVPPLLIYAELISSFDSRNIEIAERIKNKYNV